MQRLIDQVIDATGGEWPSNDFRCRAQKTLITRGEFEARVAERRNKPGWDKAPAWANWLAQSGKGAWNWYFDKPKQSLFECFVAPSYFSVHAVAGLGEVIGDWRNTLEQRPNAVGRPPLQVNLIPAVDGESPIDTANRMIHALLQRPNQTHQTGDLGRSSGTVGANHIGESDEKADIDFELTAASVDPGLGGKLLLDKVMAIAGNAFAKHAQVATEECFALMREAKDKPDNSADWYDYDKQKALRLPPVGAVVNFEWGGYHRGAVEIVAYRNNGNTAVLWHVDRDAPDAAEVMSSSFRPLDWNRNLQPEPESSPELSFHLSNAFNELQASARLLPEDDPRRASIVSLAGGVSAVKEVA